MKLFNVKFTSCSELQKVLLTELYKQVVLKAEFSNSPFMKAIMKEIQFKKNIATETEKTKTVLKNINMKLQHTIKILPNCPGLFHL